MTGREWQALEDYKEILAPLKDATVLMSSDTKPTLPSYIPMVISLTEWARDCTTKMSAQGKALARRLLFSMEKTFGSVKHDETLVLAMLIDPRYKDRFFTTRDEKVDVHRKLSVKTLSLIPKDNQQEPRQDTNRNENGKYF